MQQQFFTTVIRCSLFAGVLALSACGSDTPANHDSALPHNKMTNPGDLSEAESQELMEARGKSAQAMTPAGLEGFIRYDTAQVVAVNFWKRDCTPCLNLQLHLQRIQTKEGAAKLTILSVNLDESSEIDQVNLALRTAGFTTPVFQIDDKKDLGQKLGLTWDGSLPAIAIFSRGELEVLFRQEFAENELSAVLQPYFL